MSYARSDKRVGIALRIAWLAACAAFVIMAVRAAHGGVLAVDVSLARRVQDLPAAAGPLFDAENWLGAGLPLTAITLALAALLLRKGQVLGAALLLLTFPLKALDDIVKHVVAEPRPDASLIDVRFPHDNLSFPSGHVVGVTLVFGLVVLLAPRMFSPRAAFMVRCAAVFYIATIGLARVWVGAHWPSDVAGGYLYAAIFLIPAGAYVLQRSETAVRRSAEGRRRVAAG